MLAALHQTLRALLQSGEPGLEVYTPPTHQTLLDAFNEAASITGDIKLAKAIIGYTKGLMTKNDEHIKFFGGHSLGVERIKFLDSDRDRFFDDVLEADEQYLNECIRTTPYIDPAWNVGADPFNLAVIWAVHRLLTGPQATNPIVREGAIHALIALQFRFLTSIWFNFFRRPVDPDAAAATYTALTLKFILKREGSWGAMMRKRAEDLIDPSSIRYKTLKLFGDDEAVVRTVTDLQTRTKQTIIDMYGVLDKVRSGNLRVISTEAHSISVTGDKIIKDQVSAYNSARYYLLDVAGNESSFVKQDLINIILDLMGTVSTQAFTDLLYVVARAPEGKLRAECEWIMENTLLHAFDYIAKQRIRFNDIGTILVKMRALYMASKSSDPLLLELRSRTERFVRQNSHLRAQAALASGRTSLMLYFLLRSLYSASYK